MKHIEPAQYDKSLLSWANSFSESFLSGDTEVSFSSQLNELAPIEIVIDNEEYVIDVNPDNSLLGTISPPLLIDVDGTTQIKIYSPILGIKADDLLSKRQIEQQFRELKDSQTGVSISKIIDFSGTSNGNIDLNALFGFSVIIDRLDIKMYEIVGTKLEPVIVKYDIDDNTNILTWSVLDGSIELKVVLNYLNDKIIQ